MQAIWTVISWSFFWLYRGVWPNKDHNGVLYEPGSAEGQLAGGQLAGGYFGVPWTLKGDLKSFVECFNFRRWDSQYPCEYCRCHRLDGGPAGFEQLNFSLLARWKKSLLSVATWKAENPDKHLLFSDPWFWLSLMNCACDELHILYLGVYQTLLGTVLWLLVFRCLGGSAADNMQVVWGDIKDYYLKNGVTTQFSSLTLNSFMPDSSRPNTHYPRLKGKGMENKCLLKPLAYVYGKYCNKERQQDRDTVSMMNDMIELVDVFDEFADCNFIPQGDAKKVLGLCDRYLQRWAALHNNAVAAGDLLYHTLPKHHCFWHLCQRAQYEHPRLGNTCLDEDFVGRVKHICVASAPGVVLHNIPVKVCEKFTWGKSLMFQYQGDS